jgi:hypothetical protein
LIHFVSASVEAEKRDKLIYEVILRCHEEERKRTNELDSKANNALVFSGILTTLIAGIVGFLPDSNFRLLFVLPLVLLIISAIRALTAYSVKVYSAIQPVLFINEYSNATETKTLREYVATVANCSKTNSDRNDEKASTIKSSSTLMVISVTLFFIIVILNIVFGGSFFG